VPDETEDGPVLETLGAMTVASLERCDLAPDALLLVRIAALVAVDARPVSYLAHIGPATDAGVPSPPSSERPGSCRRRPA
jgi:hypothetical protein